MHIGVTSPAPAVIVAVAVARARQRRGTVKRVGHAGCLLPARPLTCTVPTVEPMPGGAFLSTVRVPVNRPVARMNALGNATCRRGNVDRSGRRSRADHLPTHHLVPRLVPDPSTACSLDASSLEPAPLPACTPRLRLRARPVLRGSHASDVFLPSVRTIKPRWPQVDDGP